MLLLIPRAEPQPHSNLLCLSHLHDTVPEVHQARQRCAGSDVGEKKLILAVQYTKALMSGNNPSAAAEPALPPKKPCPNLRYVSYGTEKESPFLPAIRQLISNDLSEPYSIYVYRYFLYQWGHLCFMVRLISCAFYISRSHANVCVKALDDDDNLIGVIVCKLEPHRGGPMRGYIAMLATRKDYRGHGIATSLVKMAIEKMISEDADEVSTLASLHNSPVARTDKHSDRSRNRSRQYPITTHLREPGLHSHKAIASILSQRQHRIPTYPVPEARHTMEANVPSRLPYAHVRSRSHARPWSDGRRPVCETGHSDAY